MLTTLSSRIAPRLTSTLSVVALVLCGLPASAQASDLTDNLESSFDQLLGPAKRAPQLVVTPAPSAQAPLPAASVPVQRAIPLPETRPETRFTTSPAMPTSSFEQQIAALANGQMGRIGVAAVDLSTGRAVSVLGEQPFPMASTSKVAIVSTYLDLVDQGRLKLSDSFPLMIPVPSRRFAGSAAPVRPGDSLSALSLIELTITRSDNQATDALLAAVGGPTAVNRWLRRAGLSGIRLDRDIATLVRDDGAIDPARSIDPRDSATPLAMVKLLTGIYQGQWLSASSRAVLLGAMERCVTGRRRIPAMLPAGARALHKTGTLNNTSSDVGIIETPDGRAFAVAIYVTGQGGKPARESRIATIARAVYDGYLTETAGPRRTASR